MFNFFRRKKSQGGEKKKRGSQKGQNTPEKVEAGDEAGPRVGGKFATPQTSPDARSVAIAARSPCHQEQTGETIGPPLPPKPTFRTPRIGSVPNSPVVGPPPSGPTVAMGNDSSQPIDTNDVFTSLPDIPFVDCVPKDVNKEEDNLVDVNIEKSSALSTIISDKPGIEIVNNNSCADSEQVIKKPASMVFSTPEEVCSQSLKNLTNVFKGNVNKDISGATQNDSPSEISPVNVSLKKSEHVASPVCNSPASSTESMKSEIAVTSEKSKNSILSDCDYSENNINCDLGSALVNEGSSQFENDINAAAVSLANEVEDEKSVTGNVGDYVLDLASKGLVASCEDYSSGNSPGSESNAVGPGSPDVTALSNEEMPRVRSYTQCLDKSEVLSSVDNYENLKTGVSDICNFTENGLLSKCVEDNDLCELDEKCDDANKSESDETSEDESSESEDSVSDNVIKNDSGCWDERDNCLFLSESENLVTTPSNSSVSSILRDGKIREKKHVKWADIDGKKDLTYEKENTDTFAEGSSSGEEESEEESEEGDEADDDEEAGENDESEESESEESDDNITEKIEVKVKDEQSKNEKDYKREDTWLDMNSSSEEEEEGEESNEDEIQCPNETSNVTSIPSSDKSTDDTGKKGDEESSESEESSTEEESSEDEIVKDEVPKVLRLDFTEMHHRIAELQKDVEIKTTNIDRLQVELDAACNESEMVRQRFKRLEADLDAYKQTNKELLEKIQITEHKEEETINKSTRQLEAAERRIRELEIELENLKLEYNTLNCNYKKLKADRDMEVQIIQKALEKALAGQEEMEVKYEREFEKLRTLNSSQEVQMLEDFEWKLREVERSCKKRMQEYEAEYEKKSLELANQLAKAQVDLEQVSHLKLCEIELNQLKQTSSEQRKNLRIANRKLEELQVSEKILQEEVHTLRSSLDKEKAHIVSLQALHKEELTEKDKKLKLKLELEIKQLTEEWEERLRKQNFKLKTELEKIFKEEKMLAVDSANKLKDKEIAQLKQDWEKKAQEFKIEIEKYKKKIIELEGQRKSDLNNAQTNADRELFELRRKMDKLDMSYQEKIEKIQEQHELDLATMKEECEKRVQQAEANLQIQIGNSRTTLELVKQQIRNEAENRVEKLENEYKRKLEEQWISLQREKDSAKEHMEQKHQKELETIYKEIEKMKNQAKSDQDSLTRKRNPQSNQPTRQSVMQPKNLINENETDHSQNPISTRLDVAEVAEEIRAQGKEEVLQRSIEQLTRQLNAGKMEIEKLRQQLEARDTRHQQQNQQQQQRNHQQPPPSHRRNRKGRSGRN